MYDNSGMVTRERKIAVSTDDLLSISKAAERLNVHRATVYLWIQQGRIYPIHIGGTMFVTLEDVEVLKEQREREGIVYTVHRPIKKRELR